MSLVIRSACEIGGKKSEPRKWFGYACKFEYEWRVDCVDGERMVSLSRCFDLPDVFAIIMIGATADNEFYAVRQRV